MFTCGPYNAHEAAADLVAHFRSDILEVAGDGHEETGGLARAQTPVVEYCPHIGLLVHTTELATNPDAICFTRT